MTTFEFILALAGLVFASGGFWAFITAWYNNRSKKQNALIKLMLGIGHREIVECGLEYIERGYITKDEYEDLMHFSYVRYLENSIRNAVDFSGTPIKLILKSKSDKE